MSLGRSTPARFRLPAAPAAAPRRARDADADFTPCAQVICAAPSQLDERVTSHHVAVSARDAAAPSGLDGVPNETTWALQLVQRLPRRSGEPIVVARELPARDPAAHLDADAGDVRPVQLQVLGPDGAPAPGIQVELWFAGQAGADGDPRCAARFALAPAGRAQLRLGPGRWALHAWTATAHALHLLDPADVPGELRLDLAPLPTQRLRVVDGQGQPVRGARVEPAGMLGISGSRDDLEARLRSQVLLQHGFQRARRAHSDRDGRLVLPVLDDGRLTAPIRVVAGARQSAPLRLAAADAETTVVVR